MRYCHNNYKSFFLYNHGIVIEDNNVERLYKNILSTEKIFSKLIDYKKLKVTAREVLNLDIENNKVRNIYPNIEYKKFKDKFLFPDHPVFFPNSFNYDDNYIYLNKKLNSVESIYFKTLLILYVLIDNNKIENYIKKETGRELRNSEDEQLRIQLNK